MRLRKGVKEITMNNPLQEKADVVFHLSEFVDDREFIFLRRFQAAGDRRGGTSRLFRRR